MSLAMISFVLLMRAKARGMYVMGCASVDLDTNFLQFQDRNILGWDKGLHLFLFSECSED